LRDILNRKVKAKPKPKQQVGLMPRAVIEEAYWPGADFELAKLGYMRFVKGSKPPGYLILKALPESTILEAAVEENWCTFAIGLAVPCMQEMIEGVKKDAQEWLEDLDASGFDDDTNEKGFAVSLVSELDAILGTMNVNVDTDYAEATFTVPPSLMPITVPWRQKGKPQNNEAVCEEVLAVARSLREHIEITGLENGALAELHDVLGNLIEAVETLDLPSTL
jgi:hypothetical protein